MTMHFLKRSMCPQKRHSKEKERGREGRESRERERRREGWRRENLTSKDDSIFSNTGLYVCVWRSLGFLVINNEILFQIKLTVLCPLSYLFFKCL